MLGLLTLWLVSVLGVLMVVFGILLLALKGKGAILSVSIFVTCAVVLIAAALTSGLNLSVVLTVVAGSVALPLLVFAILKTVKK